MFDNIEIGTSDFRTLIESAEGNGISIEPVPCYFDNLPNRKDWIKLNCAISDYDGKATMYYVNPDKITFEPYWVRGCNSIGKPHPTIQHNYPHLVETKEVEVLSVQTLFERYSVKEVKFMKIDTEGHDITILRALLKTKVRPEKILFESNVLTDNDDYLDILSKLHEYDCKKEGFDTICLRR